jgi:hypothetical protein
VALCEPCHAGRPARDSGDLGPADLAWRILARDVGALREAYGTGQWLPYEAELRFAEDLARVAWTEDAMRTAQRTAPPGRIAGLLDNAAFFLRYADGRDPALLPLRQLIDVLADDSEAGMTESGSHRLPDSRTR